MTHLGRGAGVKCVHRLIEIFDGTARVSLARPLRRIVVVWWQAVARASEIVLVTVCTRNSSEYGNKVPGGYNRLSG